MRITRKNASLPNKIIRQIVKPVELKGPARLYVIEIICTCTLQQLHEERTSGGSLCSGHLFSASRLQLFVLSKSDPLQSTNNTATTWWPLCTSWKLLRLLFWFDCTKFHTELHLFVEIHVKYPLTSPVHRPHEGHKLDFCILGVDDRGPFETCFYSGGGKISTRFKQNLNV